MKRPPLLRLGFALIHLHCSDCDGIIWFWQRRCRSSHTACLHRTMRGQYEKAVADGPPWAPERMWECTACGEVPA